MQKRVAEEDNVIAHGLLGQFSFAISQRFVDSVVAVRGGNRGETVGFQPAQNALLVDVFKDAAELNVPRRGGDETVEANILFDLGQGIALIVVLPGSFDACSEVCNE